MTARPQGRVRSAADARIVATDTEAGAEAHAKAAAAATAPYAPAVTGPADGSLVSLRGAAVRLGSRCCSPPEHAPIGRCA